MKFITDKKSFQNGISTVIIACASKSIDTSLEGILIEATDGKLNLYATNTEIKITTSIEANIMIEGKVLVPAKILNDIIRNFNEGDVTFEALENNNIIISCYNSVFNLTSLDHNTFPNKEFFNSNDFVKIENSVLRKMIKETTFSCGQRDGIAPVLSGVLIECDNELLKMVAIDGFRMAMREERLKDSFNNNIRCIVPSKSLNDILKIMSTYEEDVYIYITENKFIANIGKTQFISNLIKGTFPDYKNIIPKESETIVKVNKEDLLKSCERASIIIDEGRNNLINMIFEENELTIKSNSNIGKVVERVNILLNGENIDTSFNSRYFIDVLKILEDEKILIEFKGSSSACLIKPVNSSKYIYLIMPVRVG